MATDHFVDLQAQEGLISQLCEENTKLGDEIQRLNGRLVTCPFVQQRIASIQHACLVHFALELLIVITNCFHMAHCAHNSEIS